MCTVTFNSPGTYNAPASVLSQQFHQSGFRCTLNYEKLLQYHPSLSTKVQIEASSEDVPFDFQNSVLTIECSCQETCSIVEGGQHGGTRS